MLRRSASLGAEHQVPLADHLPGDPPRQKLLPARPKSPLARIVAVGPAGHVDQQRPFGEAAVFVQMLERIAGKQKSLAVGEQVGQRQVDRPHRAMKIDRAKQFGPHAMNRTSAATPRLWIVSPPGLKKL